MIRLTKTGFRQWLVMNRKVFVGQPNKMRSCPFCRYLKSRGLEKVSFPTVSCRIVGGKSILNNKWQRDFQRAAIDMERRLDVIGLRGREALQVLDEL